LNFFQVRFTYVRSEFTSKKSFFSGTCEPNLNQKFKKDTMEGGKVEGS